MIAVQMLAVEVWQGTLDVAACGEVGALDVAARG